MVWVESCSWVDTTSGIPNPLLVQLEGVTRRSVLSIDQNKPESNLKDQVHKGHSLGLKDFDKYIWFYSSLLPDQFNLQYIHAYLLQVMWKSTWWMFKGSDSVAMGAVELTGSCMYLALARAWLTHTARSSVSFHFKIAEPNGSFKSTML